MGLSSDEIGVILLSLKVACWSVALSLPPAIFIAHVLARKTFPGKTLFDAAIHLPLVLPPVVVGFALLALLGRKGPVGTLLEQWFGVVIAFKWTGAALASAIMGFPLMVRAIRLSLSTIDPRLESAARTLGASPLRVWMTILLPLATPGIAASVSSAQPSLLCPTFPVKRRRCRWRSTPRRKSPAASRLR
jgi:molybdate transport system permease protein